MSVYINIFPLYLYVISLFLSIYQVDIHILSLICM